MAKEAGVDAIQELIAELQKLRSDIANLQAELHRKYGGSDERPPLGSFGMAFNTVTLTTEVLEFYSVALPRIPIPQNEPFRTRALDENTQRLAMQQKAMYIMLLSAVEFGAKNAAREHPQVLDLKPEKWEYLKAVLGRSHFLGLVDGPDFERWKGLIEFRNVLVHNNGIADETKTYGYPNDVAIAFVEGANVRVKLPMYVRLASWGLKAYSRWCDAFLTRAGRAP